MAFTRWVRSASQKELLTAARTQMAASSGRPVRKPHGKEVFWQKVYAPVYHRLPRALRNKVIEAMPGSHRRTWHHPAQVSGPAVSATKAWQLDPERLAATVRAASEAGAS